MALERLCLDNLEGGSFTFPYALYSLKERPKLVTSTYEYRKNKEIAIDLKRFNTTEYSLAIWVHGAAFLECDWWCIS